jgi:curved DNA-binding protein
MTDPYRILGVNRNSSDSDIKSAYRQLAKKHHPDKGGDSEHFANINAAYDNIKDHNARQNFDNEPSNFQQSQPRQQPFGHNFGAGFDDMFNNMFGQPLHPNARRPHRTHNQKSRSNINVTVHVDLADVFNCVEKNINITMPNGLSKPVKLRIPPGVAGGGSVTYNSMAPDGNDLCVQYVVKPQNEYIIQEFNLVKRVNISLHDAMLGAQKTITTLDNRSLLLHIKSGTQSGTKLKISESGLSRHGAPNGDLLIDIRVKIPTITEQDFSKTFQQVLTEKLSNCN